MKTYKDIYISFNNVENIKNYIDLITKNISAPWQRSLDREKDASSFVSEQVFCFERVADDINLACGLTIFHKDEKTLYIPNIVPRESGQFSVDEYNSLLTEFYQIYLYPYADANHINIEITNDTLSDEDILNKTVADSLRRFSVLANQSTGSSHPCDRKRWYEFICLAFDLSKSKSINTELLQQILIEQGWGNDKALDLIIEYEFGTGLLEYLDEHNGR